MAGAFDICGDNLASLTFDANSKLELIERNVLNSSNLVSISTGERFNVIPETLNIETGNNLHDTTWFALLKNDQSYIGKFITLGKNIIGYIPGADFNGELDFSDASVNGCTTIFDSAFKDMANVKKVRFTDKITSIYSNAFLGTGLTELNLPNKITRIDENAFFGCKFKNLVLPASLTYIGSGAFSEDQNKTASAGTLKYVDIKDGAKISGTIFELQQDITTSATGELPSNANISLREIHIPKTMPSLIDNSFTQLKYMSQATKIYLGTLKINSEDPDNENYGTYMCENIKLYTTADGIVTYDASTNGVANTLKVDSNGNQIYCPRFYYNMAQSTKGFKQSYIETTERYSICPEGDFVGPATLYYVRRYENATYVGGAMPAINDGFTREDLLRIVAGYSSNINDDISNITLRNVDYNRIQNDINMIYQAGKRVKFIPVMI